MTKKIIAALLVASLSLGTTVPVFAAENSEFSEQYLAETGNYVLLDELETANYKISLLQEGNVIYAVTILKNNVIELAIAKDGVVRSLWLTQDDLNTNNPYALFADINDDQLVNSVINYGKDNMDRSVIAPVRCVKEISPLSRSSDDAYDSLMSQMEAIHGGEYLDRDWTGRGPETIDGHVYSYHEWLNYDVNYRTNYVFEAMTTLGDLVSLIADLKDDGSTTSKIIVGVASALDVLASASTILREAGIVSEYFGSAEYNRFINVDGGGPYHESYKWIEYNGWAADDKPEHAYLQEISVKYSETKMIFESYTRQLELAIANFGG